MRAHVLAMILVLSTLFATLGHLPAEGQTGGAIGLYSDTQGTDCAIPDAVPGVLEVNVIHSLASDCVMGAMFAVPIPTCATGLIFVGDRGTGLDPHQTLQGTSPIGIGVAYGLRFPPMSTLHILTIVYISQGTSGTCCPLQVTAAGGDFVEPPPCPNPAAVACSGVGLPVQAGTAYLNPNGSCSCAVPIETTTWGAVKALYVHEGF